METSEETSEQDRYLDLGRVQITCVEGGKRSDVIKSARTHTYRQTQTHTPIHAHTHALEHIHIHAGTHLHADTNRLMYTKTHNITRYSALARPPIRKILKIAKQNRTNVYS